jgi:hypothetical protein
MRRRVASKEALERQSLHVGSIAAPADSWGMMVAENRSPFFRIVLCG